MCKEFSLADNEFLPVYLGYFFVSLSIADCYTMAAVYVLVFIFTYLSQTQYFNPVYLLFGYHYYHVLTPKGTNVFVIKKGEVFTYIGEYCPELKVSETSFEVGNEEELKMLLYGIEQRFYTTIVGEEKRIANSVVPFGQ